MRASSLSELKAELSGAPTSQSGSIELVEVLRRGQLYGIGQSHCEGAPKRSDGGPLI